MKNYLDLSGKVALNTGASSGIGAASAMVFAKLGAQVTIAITSTRTGPKLFVSNRLYGPPEPAIAKSTPMITRVIAILAPVERLLPLICLT